MAQGPGFDSKESTSEVIQKEKPGLHQGSPTLNLV